MKTQLKILIVNYSDSEGGASRAAYRLHKALLSANVDSKMLVMVKTIDHYSVIEAGFKIQKIVPKLRPFLDQIPIRIFKKRTNGPFSCSWLPFSGVVDKINSLNPDIVHLNWINDGMVRIEELTSIKAPIIWSLHDNWIFTGGCHTTWDCERYIEMCGACPNLGSNKTKDLSRKIWNRKNNVYKEIRSLTIIGVSNWITNCSLKSGLLKSKKHFTLHNPIDTDIYKPLQKNQSRTLWNLPKNKKLVLFGALKATGDKRKGYTELLAALKDIKFKDEIELIIFGTYEPKVNALNDFTTHYIGVLHDDISLSTLYSAADVMVVPSLQESFGQTASEALACGTPVVAFATSGLLDIVDHKINGYLAEPFNTTDLANGINWILNEADRDELSRNARKKVIENFDSKVVVSKYLSICEEIISSRNSK